MNPAAVIHIRSGKLYAAIERMRVLARKLLTIACKINIYICIQTEKFQKLLQSSAASHFILIWYQLQYDIK